MEKNQAETPEEKALNFLLPRIKKFIEENPNEYLPFEKLSDLKETKMFVQVMVDFAALEQRREERNIVSLERERLAWSLETFTEATAISSIRKCEEELKEIEADILTGEKNPEEYADALMCLFDSAGRHGIAVEEIFSAFAAKLEKNKSRVWKKNADNSYSHIKPNQQ